MDKKEKILNASLKVYAKKGSRNFSMDDIAKTADIGKGTIYLYFKSKDELFFESIFYALHALLNIFRKEIDKQDSATKKLQLYIEKSIKEINKKNNPFIIIINEFPSFLSSMKNRKKKCNEHKGRGIYFIRQQFLKSIIEEGMKNNEFKNIDTDIFSHLIIGGINSFFIRRVLSGEKIKNNKIKTFSNMILSIIIKEDK